MTAAVWTTFVVVAFVGLGLLSYLVETMGDRIAGGRPAARGGGQNLRAEDAVSGRRDAGRPATAEPSHVRGYLVALTIISILLTALVGIMAFYDHDGGRSSELEWQSVMTTLVMAVIGIATLCYLATAGTRYWWVGVLGGLVLGWSAAYTLLLIWHPGFRADETEPMMRLYGVGVILTVLLAQIALILGGAGDRPRLRVVLWPTVVLSGAAAALAVSLAPAGGGLGALGAEARTTAHENATFVAVAIIVALGIPLALALFGTRSPKEETPLAAGLTRNP